MSVNGYQFQQYKEQTIMTMTKEELLLVLFDELTKRLKRAEISIEVEKYDIFQESVNRSVEIVKYLKSSLNFEYSISRELANMYDFFLFELSRLQASRKKEIIGEIIPLIKSLRETFEQAGKQQ